MALLKACNAPYALPQFPVSRPKVIILLPNYRSSLLLEEAWDTRAIRFLGNRIASGFVEGSDEGTQAIANYGRNAFGLRDLSCLAAVSSRVRPLASVCGERGSESSPVGFASERFDNGRGRINDQQAHGAIEADLADK